MLLVELGGFVIIVGPFVLAYWLLKRKLDAAEVGYTKQNKVKE